MSDWQERITHSTAPGIRTEHELRYHMLAPLTAASAVWTDLGCGSGVAAAAALGDRRPEHAVLVDLEQELVESAARELPLARVEGIAADITQPDALERIGTAMLAVQGERLVSCFEVVEHLSTFVPLLEWAGALARERAATFVISVPNDAFWSISNPYHLSSWGEGAFEELQRLLPAERTLLRQVALNGSALLDWDARERQLELVASAGGEDTVATHFIAAFGPRHNALRAGGALAVQTDMLAQRRWERQRESNLAVAQELAGQLQGAVRELQVTIEQQRTQLRANTAQFEEWRAYIHELERKLGRPLAGSAEAMRRAGVLRAQAPAASAADEQEGTPKPVEPPE